MRFPYLLLPIGVAAFFSLFLYMVVQPEPPPRHWAGHIAQDLAQPSMTPWASLLTDDRVVSPPGALLKVATFTPTPTPTATPTPTPTPLPTWTPEPVYPTWTPEPPVAERPVVASASGDVQSLICSFGWNCATALAVASCESGLNPNAYNGHHVGLFQLDPYFHTWRSPTGEIWSAYGNVAAAYHLYLEQGWGPWDCA